ncbi:hypothetical protein [Streptomyces aidingensis]|uniref:Uncharacterized protein n=1 Tax=Streptomyces aidingensis TaxID=910347 RepID=A0A1I1J475_9ACTN|nr:hypothetical protein [Streptomyces aidingensis]SFC43304.1 hypothetical protein SAMN05421773_103282 [Streptomyces aidingensis]
MTQAPFRPAGGDAPGAVPAPAAQPAASPPGARPPLAVAGFDPGPIGPLTPRNQPCTTA